MKDYTTQPLYEVEPTDRHKEDFKYHNNSEQWEENENNLDEEDFKSINPFSYRTINKYDIHIRQPPVHRQRKVGV